MTMGNHGVPPNQEEGKAALAGTLT